MKNCFLLYICLINILTAYSQTQIQVTVVDSITNTPLPFATIYLKKTGVGTTTNAEGIASLQIKNNQILKDTFVCSYIGYQKKIIPIA